MASEYSVEGTNYGDFSIADKKMHLKSVVSSQPVWGVSCENISQCVVPQTNRDELEIQFADSGAPGRHEDIMVQMTLHFAAADEDGDAENTQAETVQQQIMDMGVLTSLTGDIIAEFTKDMGNFVMPRGKYALQLTPSYVHMQGPQYSYKINYDDINALYLLDKADKTRMAFVIALEKPIRQGNQKYMNLVIDTHKIEHTLKINLSEQEIADKYGGELQREMTMPLSSLLAKAFKIIGNKKVFIPKQFESFRQAHCVNCVLKTAEGTLFPLGKSFIFIHKPTVIISFDSIEHIEFKRYEPTASFATRNFDMVVTMKNPQPGEPKEYPFNLIDRTEYPCLYDYVKVKNIPMLNEVAPGAAVKKPGFLGEDDDNDDDNDDDDDDDYEGGGSQEEEEESSDGQDSEGGDSDAEVASDASGDMAVTGVKRKKETSSRMGSKKGAGADGKKGKKGKRAKKDKNAPKGAMGAFMMFSQEMRGRITEEMGKLPLAEMGKELGKRWREATAEERKPFEEQAAQDKQRFNEEMRAYKAAGAGDGGSASGSDN